jgi:predicted dehydrogenase
MAHSFRVLLWPILSGRKATLLYNRYLSRRHEQRTTDVNRQVRLGIVGLGRRWQRRYLPALTALNERFSIAGVCDPVKQRAAAEARRLGCPSAAGPNALLERDDVDALLIADHQWFGLWPVEQACRLGKPALCGATRDCLDAHLSTIYEKAQTAGIPVVMALTFRLEPAAVRLLELCQTEIGPARFLLCDEIRPSSRAQRPYSAACPDPDSIWRTLGDSGISCLDYGAWLLGDAPTAVSATGLGQEGIGMLIFQFGAERAIHMIGRRLPAARPALRLQVIGEQASATVKWRGLVSWTSRTGTHWQRLTRQRPRAELLLEHFWRVVREGETPVAGLPEAYRIFTWLRAAADSWVESRPVSLAADHGGL